MADVVSSVINSTLVPLLSGEVNLLRNVHTEVASIKSELESIMSFLEDADSSAKLENRRTKNRVKQARAVAYRIEDVMDEYILRLAENRQQHGSIRFLRKLVRSITKLKPKHDIASQIRAIKKDILEIKGRDDRHNFNSLERGSSNKNEEEVQYDPHVVSLFIEEEKVVGIESTRDELIHRLIIGESNRTVTSLVGMGGCGKTTLAKTTFDNQKVCERFDCQAWVSVSQSYKPEDIFRRMMKELCQRRKEHAPEGIDMMDQSSLIRMLRDYLHHKRYLLVFDDVWSTDFWTIVRTSLPEKNKGSHIIVTTRNEDVAAFCKESSSDKVCKVEPMIEAVAWNLFSGKTFQPEFDGCCPPELEKVSRNIVGKCEGLPLAIVTIGGLLSTKRKVATDWERFYNSLGSELQRNPRLTNISKFLLLSYHDLPYCLKPCFLYFGIIPKNYQITRGRLIRLWIAEGFIERQRGKTLEEVAEEHLTELVHRSLVQVSKTKVDGRIKSCQVHDIVREIILTTCEETSFGQVLGEEADPIWNDETRRWSMHMHSIANWDLETIGSTKSKIRSVFLFSIGELPNQLLGTLAVNFKLLKVLDLQGARLDELDEEVGNLHHLRYLSVKWTNVKIIPKSIGNLRNLQTLNLKHSRVFVLQIGILSRLRKLRHLIASSRDFFTGVKIQEGIGHLKELQTLWGVEIVTIKELENLEQLRKLGIVKLQPEDGKALCATIEKMKHLQYLRVTALNVNEVLDLHSLSSPPEYLQFLSLGGRLETFPTWISKLDNLVSLTLNHSRLTDTDAIKALQALPSLIELYMFKGYEGEQLRFDDTGFQKLKMLSLLSLEELNSFIIEEGALPVLNELWIGDCPYLKEDVIEGKTEAEW